MNPIAGLIEWADECFLDADKMPVRPDWNPHDFKIKRSPSDSLDGLDDFGDGGYEGTGWFFCVPKNRFVQQDPILVCPDNALTGKIRYQLLRTIYRIKIYYMVQYYQLLWNTIRRFLAGVFFRPNLCRVAVYDIV